MEPGTSIAVRPWWRLSGWPGRLAAQSRFRNLYFFTCLGLLLASALYWGWLGARLQAQNADQLVDPYLFGNWATFHGATFPASHTFLLKWPVFWLLSLVGITTTSLTVATMAMVLLTVGLLAYVLYKIERRALVIGTVWLGLALALVLTPTLPYAGGILPVNMAMLTTRNIEYVAYIGAFVLLARSTKIRSWRFLLATGLLGLLFTSDRLFLGLSAGGALLSLVVYSLVRNWALVTCSVRWLVSTLLAAAGSVALLSAITSTHVTKLAGDGGSPYALVSGGKQLVLGGLYVVLGLGTNAGANPIDDNRLVNQLPHQLVHGLLSFSGLAHVVATVALIYSVVLGCRLLWPTLRKIPRRSVHYPVATLLSLSLVASLLMAGVMFVGTAHYYAVDARYLGLVPFALSVCVVTVLRRQTIHHYNRLLLAGAILGLGILGGVVTAHHVADRQMLPLTPVANQNNLVAQALNNHKVDVLVGDYWRVLPIKLASHGTINSLPLSSCTETTGNLTSTTWSPNLAHHSFAYLLSFTSGLTNFPQCSLEQVTQKYGRPDATQVISGSLTKPREVLLFYDRGEQTSKSTAQGVTLTNAILPITPAELTGTNCDTPTIMNIVAHQDDDLLFMSPDLLHDIDAGHCIRTVYLTAGDSGRDKFYWLGRQLGAEAAYSQMLHDKSGWIQHTVKLAGKAFVTVANPTDNTKVSLIFYNLPDGGLQGEGFSVSKAQSLAKLVGGSLPALTTVDNQSIYSLAQLEDALAGIMNIYNPIEIRTQAGAISSAYPDHSDHIATGKIASAATGLYAQRQFENRVAIVVRRYIGYPIHGYPANVSGTDLSRKEAAFLAYAQHDGGVCQQLSYCFNQSTYGFYLTRQYEKP